MVKHIVMFQLKENSLENLDLVLSTLKGTGRKNRDLTDDRGWAGLQ
jgi:hypothetical protein